MDKSNNSLLNKRRTDDKSSKSSDTKSSRWSLSNLFRSHNISSTNPSYDIAKILGKSVNEVPTHDRLFDDITYNNYSKIVSQIRNEESVSESNYAEYKLMESEVIVQSALKSYADDATTIDVRQDRIIWVTSNDESLAKELNNFLDSIDYQYKLWGLMYNLCQYGDWYYENIYNDRGYLVGIRDTYDPSTIYHITDPETDSSGYLVRNDLTHRSSIHRNEEYDLYGIHKYTHYYLNSTGTMNTVTVDILDNNSGLSQLQLTINRGKSILESVRLNYRILRLLEDTMVTNKIAKAEYIRLINVEVGDRTGIEADSILRKFKRMLDSKPKFDTTTGSYTNQKVYRSSADIVVNATNQGVGAVDLKEVGGNIETQHLVDVEYFRNKMFTGLQVPKAHMGFTDDLPSNQGDTLSKQDIKYSRAVRRAQLGAIRGTEDLLDAYLTSRGRESDAYKFQVNMMNPNNLEEISRLDELKLRFEIIDNIVNSINSQIGEHVNVSLIYTELINEFIDDPNVVEIFSAILGESTSHKYIVMQTSLNQARSDLINSVNDLHSSLNGSTDEFDDFSMDDELSDSDDLDFSRPSGGSSFSRSSLSDFDFDDKDLDDNFDLEFDKDSSTGSTTDNNDTTILDKEPEIKLGSLGESKSLRTRLINDLTDLHNYGPIKYRSECSSMIDRLLTTSFNKSSMTEAMKLMKSVSESTKISKDYLDIINKSIKSNNLSSVSDKVVEILTKK